MLPVLESEPGQPGEVSEKQINRRRKSGGEIMKIRTLNRIIGYLDALLRGGYFDDMLDLYQTIRVMVVSRLEKLKAERD